MPLIKGIGRDVISQNMKTEMAHGKPKEQAIAIALEMAKRSKGMHTQPIKPARMGSMMKRRTM